MRLVIIGGSGLIGSALADEASRMGLEAIIVSRRPKGVLPPGGGRVVSWDGATAQGWGSLADGANAPDGQVAIVNLAGESIGGTSLLTMRWTPERKRGIMQSRAHAGAAVVEAARMAAVKPQVVVQVSAVGFYGPSRQPHLDESAEAGNDFLASVCREWEDASQPVEAMGVRRVVTRLGVVLSTRGGAMPRQMLPFRLFLGGPIASGAQGYSWIHLADAVGAILYLVAAPQAGGVFNLTSPEPVTNAEFGRALSRVMNRPYGLPVPAFAMRLAFGEAATAVLDGQFVFPDRLMALGYRFRFPGLEAALRDLLA